MTAVGTGAMARVQWRTGWRGILGWTFGLLAVLGISAVSVLDLYQTPAQIQTYEASTSSGAMAMLNGDVAGTDTIGGILANEFGFVVAFFVPLMAIALVARSTRRDEEAGRLELLLASRIGRQAPLVAAIVVALLALAALALGVLVLVASSEASTGGAALYATALFALGAVYVGVAAVLAQLVEHNRSVWAAGLAVVVLAYLLRGVGAVQDSGLIWASPLGWYDRVAPFGEEPRPWVLLLSAALATVLIGGALVLSARRDVGAALLPARRAPARATGLLRSPFGLALHEHRGPILGWVVIALALMGTYGALAGDVLEAMESNPDLAQYIGAGGGEQILEQVEGLFVMMLAMLAAALVIQAVGSLRSEESTGRLEAQLVEGRTRPAWLAVHVLVVAVGAVLALLLGGLVLGLTTSASLADDAWTARLLGASVPHLSSTLFFLGLAVALFGLAPRWRSLAWVVFGAGALLAWMGPALDLPTWLVEASPFAAVGILPAEDVDLAGVAVLVGLGLVLLVAGVVGFRRRDVPQQ